MTAGVPSPGRPAASSPLFPAALALGTTAVLFLVQYRLGLNLWDEGFLWYGTQRTLLGEIPLRDFSSYEPGRYYWSAFLMRLWGSDGVLGLRAAVAVFQCIGVFLWFLLLRQGCRQRSLLLWCAATLTLAVWMFPRHKLFDITISIAFMGVLAFLLQRPSSGRYFLSGLVLGIVAFFGRNHAAYGLAANLLALLFLRVRSEPGPRLSRALGCWLTGIAVGLLPFLPLLATAPGFMRAFLDTLAQTAQFAEGDLSKLPAPWPWLAVSATRAPLAMLQDLTRGLFFLAVFAAGFLGCGLVFWQRLRRLPTPPVLAAASFTALPYAHHAYFWPDSSHLAQSVFPFLTCAFVLLTSRPGRLRQLLVALLCAASLLVMGPMQPFWRDKTGGPWTETMVGGEMLKVQPRLASELKAFEALVEQYAPGGRSFLVAPSWPGAYAVFRRQSPMWDSYPLLPRGEQFERQELARIKAAAPGFALLIDFPLAGRDELRFRNTHPLIQQYIHDNFIPVETPDLPSSYRVFVVP